MRMRVRGSLAAPSGYGKSVLLGLVAADRRPAHTLLLSDRDNDPARLVYENSWAAPFVAAVQRSGGELVVAGTATAVSGRVRRRRESRWAEKEEQQYAQQLTEEEFAAQKAKLLS